MRTALVERMSIDSTARERAQLALARLQDPHGYDVWWLAGDGAVERRSWYAVFPVLTTSAIGLAALAPFWSPAVVPLVAVLILNLAVRYATDFRVGPVARSFRQRSRTQSHESRSKLTRRAFPRVARRAMREECT